MLKAQCVEDLLSCHGVLGEIDIRNAEVEAVRVGDSGYELNGENLQSSDEVGVKGKGFVVIRDGFV